MSHVPLFGLINCNNFFVSCERANDPSLNDRPVIVLSNNDGCVISRSNEAKALGVKMGQPFFQLRYLVQRHDIAVLSAHFDMITYMSAQVMDILAQFTPTLEIYSADEAFFDMTGQKGLPAYGKTIRQAVLDHVGVPVSVGFAPTKTLAKVASELAKISNKANGVVDLSEPTFHNAALERLPVKDVWGVGWQLTTMALPPQGNCAIAMSAGPLKRTAACWPEPFWSCTAKAVFHCKPMMSREKALFHPVVSG